MPTSFAVPQIPPSIPWPADPFPTPEMYFRDAKGKLHTIRGTSQLESIHRFLKESIPGTYMSLEGADARITDYQYRCAAVCPSFMALPALQPACSTAACAAGCLHRSRPAPISSASPCQPISLSLCAGTMPGHSLSRCPTSTGKTPPWTTGRCMRSTGCCASWGRMYGILGCWRRGREGWHHSSGSAGCSCHASPWRWRRPLLGSSSSRPTLLR